MLMTTLLGQIKQTPGQSLQDYNSLDDDGNVIIKHNKMNHNAMMIIYALQQEFHEYREVKLPNLFYPRSIKIRDDGIIFAYEKHQLYYLDINNQSVIKLNFKIQGNIFCYYGTQIYENSSIGIKVIELANYPNIIQFLIPEKEIHRIQLVRYSNTTVLEVVRRKNYDLVNYKLPISQDNPSIINIKIKQSMLVKSSKAIQDRIATFHVPGMRNQYSLIKAYHLFPSIIYTDKFHIFIYHDTDYDKSTLILQTKPKQKILRKLLRTKNIKSTWQQAVLNEKYIFGNFDSQSYSIYNVTNGQKIEQLKVEGYSLSNGMLLQQIDSNINVYQISMKKTRDQE